MRTTLYRYIPLSERNDPNPFFVIFKIPRKIEIEIFYEKVTHLISNSYETPYLKTVLPPKSELILQVNSVCLPAIVSWENMLERDGSQMSMEMNKSNTISLEALQRMPTDFKKELSDVIKELVFFGENISIINKHKIDILKVNVDFPPFQLYDDELQRYAESTFKINISDEDKKIVDMAMELQTLREDLNAMANTRSTRINELLHQIIELEEIEHKSAEEQSQLEYLYDEIEREKKSIVDKSCHTENKERKSILERYNPIEGGETVLYYLRLRFRGKKYYKVGVTLRDVPSRYTKNDSQFIEKILYEKRLTHANTIEQKILNDFKNHIFPLAILSSGHSEVFDYDILELDL